MFFKISSKPAHLALLGTLILFACGATFAQDVHYNFKAGTDFAKYHTYKWIALPGNVPPDQLIDQEIKQSIDGQLAGKGLSKTDNDKADLYVGYQGAIDREKEWTAFGDGFGPWGFGGMGMATATSSTIQNGTLVVDIYDPAAKQLVWSGQAVKTLSLSHNPQKNRERLDSAMKKLLKNYPPPPNK
jgi:hypothetical protein